MIKVKPNGEIECSTPEEAVRISRLITSGVSNPENGASKPLRRKGKDWPLLAQKAIQILLAAGDSGLDVNSLADKVGAGTKAFGQLKKYVGGMLKSRGAKSESLRIVRGKDGIKRWYLTSISPDLFKER